MSTVQAEHFFEDFHVGDIYTSPTYTVTTDDIIAFAQQYDPQPFHTDPVAAQKSVFGQLVASGWQTAAITMRLFVQSDVRPAGGAMGAGAESLKWTRPVVPGDVLTATIEVASTRVSQSKPDRGIVTYRLRTSNAAGDIVLEMMLSGIVPRRDQRAEI